MTTTFPLTPLSGSSAVEWAPYILAGAMVIAAPVAAGTVGYYVGKEVGKTRGSGTMYGLGGAVVGVGAYLLGKTYLEPAVAKAVLT